MTFGSRHSRRTDLVVWGGIFAKGKNTVRMVDHMWNVGKYIALLDDLLLPFTYLEHSVKKIDFIFRQDNRAVDMAKTCNAVFKDANLSILP